MLTHFFIAFVWLLFGGIVVFIGFNWRKRVANKTLIHIRKIWFGLYFLGALIYWTSDPISIFSDWLNYLIVAVVFVLVDGFIFLGLYLKKAGNSELDRMPEALTEISDKIVDYRSKVKHVRDILLSDAIIGYYTSEEAYFEALKKTVQLYAESERLIVQFLYYETERDKEEVKQRYGNPDFLKIEAHLQSKETYYSKDSKFALFPVTFRDKLLIIEVRSVKSINEVDMLSIDILLNMFVIVTELEEDKSNG